MESILNNLKILIQRIGVIFISLMAFIGAVASFDAYMLKYAKAADINRHDRAIGGLIELQERQSVERWNLLIEEQIHNIDRKLIDLDTEYAEKQMPSGIRRLKESLQRKKRQLERKLK